jgi:transglutaminase superfamily protein
MKLTTMRRVYLREAAVTLILARLAACTLRPARLFAWANRPPRRSRRFVTDETRWVAWAVEHTGARMKAASLPRALATHAMLRRRGIASRLCLGVARQDGGLETRAWIETGADTIVGEASGFTRLAAFGPT